MEIRNLSKYIDHTLLKADATEEQIRNTCREARKYDTASVCVNSSRIPVVVEELAGTDIKACCVVGFPLGAMLPAAKAAEAAFAIEAGAQEIDMVINIGKAKDGLWDYVQKDIEAVKAVCTGKALLKVIIETCLLTDEEKVRACQAAKAAGADFVKTSTGFSTGGATAQDVKLMRETVGEEMGVKASGGVRTKDAAIAMIESGATRIGASSSKSILEG